MCLYSDLYKLIIKTRIKDLAESLLVGESLIRNIIFKYLSTKYLGYKEKNRNVRVKPKRHHLNEEIRVDILGCDKLIS